MGWLTEPERNSEDLASDFRTALAREGVMKIPGAHDALTGLMAKRAGFRVLYLSGAAYTASRGLPDLGLVTAAEVAERVRDIVRATQLPVLVDVDTGYGGVLDVARTAREMTAAGAAALQIEDQDLPKKCGHLSGKRLVTAEEMCQKIRMIRQVSPHIVIVARTDARGVSGMEEAVRRARLYREAGADAIFPEALGSADEFRAMAESVQGPLLANMTEFGKTPYLTADEFAELGYKMVLYPVSSLRVAMRAVEDLFAALMADGTQRDLLDRMQTRKNLYETIDYFAYEALDQRVARSTLPSDE